MWVGHNFTSKNVFRVDIGVESATLTSLKSSLALISTRFLIVVCERLLPDDAQVLDSALKRFFEGVLPGKAKRL